MNTIYVNNIMGYGRSSQSLQVSILFLFLKTILTVPSVWEKVVFICFVWFLCPVWNYFFILFHFEKNVQKIKKFGTRFYYHMIIESIKQK